MKNPLDYLTNLNPYSTYGVLVSGGLDSAVMLALLVKNNPSIRFQCFTMVKPDDSYKYVPGILSAIQYNLNATLPDTHTVSDPGNLYHREYSAYLTDKAYEVYPDISYIFNGVTSNPPELMHYNGAPERATGSESSKIIMPFVHVTKEVVVDLMFDHGVEWLSDVTHTCTRLKKGRCGVCFQCQERKFAYIMNSKVDTGVL